MFDNLDDPKTQFLLMAGLGLLGGAPGQRKNFGADIAHGGLLGLQGYSQAKSQQQRLAEQKQAQEMRDMQMAQMKQQVADQARLRSLLTGRDQASSAPPVASSPASPPSQNFMGANPDFQPPPMALAGPKGTPPAVVPRGDGSKSSLYQQLTQTAERLERGGLPEKAIEYRTLAEKYRPELKDTKTLVDPTTNKRVTVNLYKDGTREVLPFAPDMEPLHFADTGGAIRGLDKFTGLPVSPALPKSMTPGEVDASRRGNEGLRLQREQFNRGTYDADRGGYVTPGGFAGVPNLPGGSKAQQDRDDLRKEFNALPEVKNYRDISAIYNAAKKAPDTPAGDFALIYGVGKILDPGSVVREGEMNLVMAAGSPAQRVQGYLNYLQGAGRLTPEQRNELRMMLNNAASERKTLYEGARKTYGGIAEQRGYKSDEIFIGSPELADTKAESPKPLSSAEQDELRRLRQKHRR